MPLPGPAPLPSGTPRRIVMAWEEAAMEEGTKEMTAVERARDYGTDISLLESALALTPTERLIQFEGMLELVEEITRARLQRDASNSNTPSAPRGRGR